MASSDDGLPIDAGAVPLDDCAFTIIAAHATPVDPLDYYKQLREYVQHENHLMHVRMTWSLTSHGFLFAAYGLTFQKTVDVLNGLYANPAALLPFVLILLFQLLICRIGHFFSSTSTAGISAAQDAINHIDTIACAGLLRLRLPSSVPIADSAILLPRIIGGGMKTPWSGVDAWSIPFWFGKVWLALLVLSLLTLFAAICLIFIKFHTDAFIKFQYDITDALRW
jgi:hypothetical protein